jgi:hypothetical protein
MDDEVEAVVAKKRFQRDAVADIQIVVREVLADAAQAVKIPSCVTKLAEENAAHVVVHAVNFTALAVKMFDGFRANQPAGTSNQNCLRSHDRSSISGEQSVNCVELLKKVVWICDQESVPP